jgi:hypothetical protein
VSADRRSSPPLLGLETRKGLTAKLARWLAFALWSLIVLQAQDLAPRAYVITPLHASAITLTWAAFDGGLYLNGAVPIEGATGTYIVPVFSYYHSFSFIGRSANIVGSLPYAVGTFEGSVQGTEQQIYRSGLLDASFRLSVNLRGGPAMRGQQFAKWKQKALLGASLKVVAPTGQYDSAKLINWGINRWAFKPEIGYSQRWGKWVLDGYAGLWIYTTNHAFYSIPRPAPQAENPIGSFEGHLSYDFSRLRGWVSVDGNFWFGGVTSLDGTQNPATRQTSSRLGATASLPVAKHQSIKVSYSYGTYVRFGGNYHSLSVAWQYSRLGRP